MGEAQLTKINGTSWRVHRGPSIFTSRRGKEDVRIMREARYEGAKHGDKYYMTRRVLAAEDGAILRDYDEPVPEELSVKNLIQMGLIDKEE